MHATCPVNLIHLYMIAVMVFGEMYKSQNSSLRSFLQAAVRVFLCTLMSNTPSLVLTWMWETRSHTHTEQQTTLYSQRIQTNSLHNTTFYSQLDPQHVLGRFVGHLQGVICNNRINYSNEMCSVITSCVEFWFVIVMSKYLKFSTFSKGI
jgi:hypothetical protein